MVKENSINHYKAKPTDKKVYLAVLSSVDNTTRDTWVDFSAHFTGYPKSTFKSGHHILCHLASLHYTAALAINLSNMYYIFNSAELLIAQMATINTILKLNSASTKTNDQRIGIYRLFVEKVTQGENPLEAATKAINEAPSKNFKFVCTKFIEDQRNKKNKYKNKKHNNYYKQFNNNNQNNNNQNNNNQYNNNNSNNFNTEPKTRHLDKNLSAPSSNVKPHTCAGKRCRAKGCSNSNNNKH